MIDEAIMHLSDPGSDVPDATDTPEEEVPTDVEVVVGEEEDEDDKV